MDVTLTSAAKAVLLAIIVGLVSSFGRSVNDSHVIERLEVLEAICQP